MKIKAMTLFIILFTTITSCKDLDFKIYKDVIEIINKTDTVKMALENIKGLKEYLISVTNRFEEDVRIGNRNQVFNGISVKVVDTIVYKEMVDALYIINGYCYQELKTLEILQKEIKLCNAVNPGNYNCWKESRLIIVNKNEYKMSYDSLARKCSDDKIRILSDATTKIDKILDGMLKLSNIDSCIYQLCNADRCIGCNRFDNIQNYFDNTVKKDKTN